MQQVDRRDGQKQSRRSPQGVNLASADLRAFLELVAVMAAKMQDVDASVGITLIRDGEVGTVASSDHRAVILDEAQYADGDGPCLQSARTGQVVTVAHVDTETRWPGSIAEARRQGLRSSMSVPLELHDTAAGALNVYAFDHFDFTYDGKRAMHAAFCAGASVAINLELRQPRLSTQGDHLQASMAPRKVIDQAIGILMARNRCSADKAFATLRMASHQRNVEVHTLAAEVIQTASGSTPDFDTRIRLHDSGERATLVEDERVHVRAKRCPRSADGDHDFSLSVYADTRSDSVAQVYECRCCGYTYGDHRPADKRVGPLPSVGSDAGSA